MSFFRPSMATQESQNRAKSRDLKKLNTPAIFEKPVDLNRVNTRIIRGWVIKKLNELVPDDDIVISYALELIFETSSGTQLVTPSSNSLYSTSASSSVIKSENSNNVKQEDSKLGSQPKVMKAITPHLPNIKEIQLQLQEFLGGSSTDEKGQNKCLKFCTELWEMLLEAQEDPDGIPPQLIAEKRKEVAQREIKREAYNGPNSGTSHHRINGPDDRYQRGRGNFRDREDNDDRHSRRIKKEDEGWRPREEKKFGRIHKSDRDHSRRNRDSRGRGEERRRDYSSDEEDNRYSRRHRQDRDERRSPSRSPSPDQYGSGSESDHRDREAFMREKYGSYRDRGQRGGSSRGHHSERSSRSERDRNGHRRREDEERRVRRRHRSRSASSSRSRSSRKDRRRTNARKNGSEHYNAGDSDSDTHENKPARNRDRHRYTERHVERSRKSLSPSASVSRSPVRSSRIRPGQLIRSPSPDSD